MLTQRCRVVTRLKALMKSRRMSRPHRTHPRCLPLTAEPPLVVWLVSCAWPCCLLVDPRRAAAQGPPQHLRALRCIAEGRRPVAAAAARQQAEGCRMVGEGVRSERAQLHRRTLKPPASSPVCNAPLPDGGPALMSCAHTSEAFINHGRGRTGTKSMSTSKVALPAKRLTLAQRPPQTQPHGTGNLIRSARAFASRYCNQDQLRCGAPERHRKAHREAM